MGEYYIEHLLPQALLFGMSSHEFWEEDPALLWSYYLAYKQKEELETTQMDTKAWLYGSYVYEAVGVVLSNALGGKSRGPRLQYPVKPRVQKQYTHLSEEEQLIQQQKEMSAKIKAMHRNLSQVPVYRKG